MSKTSDLAARYSALTDALDDLYNNLITLGQNGLATQVQIANDKVAQAVVDLAGLDAIDRLTNPQDQQVLADLTKTMNDKNDDISKQEARVTAVVGIVDNLANVVTNFAGGNIVAAVTAASGALSGLKALPSGA